MTNKKVDSAIGNWFRIFSPRLCQSFYDVKPNAQLEPCAPLAIRCLIGRIRIRNSDLRIRGTRSERKIYVSGTRVVSLLNVIVVCRSAGSAGPQLQTTYTMVSSDRYHVRCTTCTYPGVLRGLDPLADWILTRAKPVAYTTLRRYYCLSQKIFV